MHANRGIAQKKKGQENKIWMWALSLGVCMMLCYKHNELQAG